MKIKDRRNVLYDTSYGLPQSMVDYLNQALPDISGILKAVQPDTPEQEDTSPPESGLTPEQLALLYPQNVGGDNFSVYNPDPSTVRGPIDMSQDSKPVGIYNYLPGVFDDSFYNRLAEKGILEYGNSDYFPEPTGIEKLMDNEIIQGALAAINPFGTATKNIFTGIGSLAPINERAIQEKAMRQMGYSVDDIGRIVSGRGAYDTAQNVMSGYNLSQMTPETFDKRISSILGRKAPQTDASRKRIEAIQKARQDFIDAQKLTKIRKEAEERSRNVAAEAKAKQRAKDLARMRGGVGRDDRPDDRPDRGGSQTQRDAGPGFSGSGSAAEMGSF